MNERLRHLDRRQIEELERPLRELLRDFTYRPGWTFSVRDGELRIKALVIDANNPTQTISVMSVRRIPMDLDYAGEFDWSGWLFGQVLDFERHETMEFFKIKGRHVYEPHPEPW